MYIIEVYCVGGNLFVVRWIDWWHDFLMASSDSMGSSSSPTNNANLTHLPHETMLLESSFDGPGELFPSMEYKHRKKINKAERKDTTVPLHLLQSNTTLLSQSFGSGLITDKKLGRPPKPVVGPLLPKRSVGRPRIHPVKVVDPNKPKRGTIESVMLSYPVVVSYPLIFSFSCKGRQATW